MIVRPTAAVAMGVLGTGLAAGPLAAGDGNHVEILAVHINDQVSPDAEYFIEVTVALPQLTATVNSVAMTPPFGGPIALTSEDPHVWRAETDFSDFTSMHAVLDGAWTIAIDMEGYPAHISVFEINASTLIAEDFHDTPTVLTPEHGAVGVASDVTFTWIDPTGGARPDAIFVQVDSDTTEQNDSSLEGSMTITDTAWTPPLLIAPGAYEFSVGYFDIDDAYRSSPVVTIPGPIAWGNSPFAPEEYTDGAPLLVFGSEAIIEFNVGTPCPGDVDGNASVGFTDLLAVISAWGCAGDCEEDVDGDHFVGFTDLLTVMSTWGPCAD